MKGTVFLLLIGLAIAAPATAADEAPGGVSSMLVDALRGLSALLPKPDVPAAEKTAVATMGIRGSESTTSLMTPYWKDDRSGDPAFAAELLAYTAAQNLLQERRWDEARNAMAQFLAGYPQSDLVANARFGQAVANAGAANAAEAASQFRQFVSDYPEHPLRADAEKLAAALGG
jgi:TolA-binding protein